MIAALSPGAARRRVSTNAVSNALHRPEPADQACIRKAASPCAHGHCAQPAPRRSFLTAFVQAGGLVQPARTAGRHRARRRTLINAPSESAKDGDHHAYGAGRDLGGLDLSPTAASWSCADRRCADRMRPRVPGLVAERSGRGSTGFRRLRRRHSERNLGPDAGAGTGASDAPRFAERLDEVQSEAAAALQVGRTWRDRGALAWVFDFDTDNHAGELDAEDQGVVACRAAVKHAVRDEL